MPFKFNVTRRHRIPKARCRVRNWPAYEAGLRRRGDLTLWIDEAAVAGWQAPRRSTPGGQAIYSDLAIQMVLSASDFMAYLGLVNILPARSAALVRSPRPVIPTP